MKRQDGIVSIIATMVFGLLASVFAVSSVALQVSEQRQAEDIDQSVKAYFAADAGVEDALLQVRNGTVPAVPTCRKYDLINDTPTQPDQVGYTCQLITTSAPVLEGSLAREQSAQFELDSADNLSSVTIRWHINNTDTPSPLPASFGASFTSGAAWNAPSAIEISDIHFRDATTNSDDIRVKNVILRPRRPGGSAGGPITGSVEQEAQCQPDSADPTPDGYDCEYTLTQFQSQTGSLPGLRRHIIRIRPRYGLGTHYSVEFRNTLNNQIEMDDQYATIDVTAKAGDAYRRVRAKVPIRGAVASGLDYVLFSDTDLCKNFRVRDANNSGRGGAEDDPSSSPCPFAPFTP